MASAAMHALYDNMTPKDISYHHLSNSDIKKLVTRLSDYPTQPDSDSSEKYWEDLKEDIKHLPSYLKSRKLDNLSIWEHKNEKGITNKLCSGHKGLNHSLVRTIWANIRAEFESGIGPFLYPLIMEAGLPKQAEWKVRQLEPVLEMWCKDFKILDHTPPGRDPLRPVEMVNEAYLTKWRLQVNKCPGCILARIGSDRKVLFALLAGMVGRYSDRVVGKQSDIKSKRVRLVRYWLRRIDSNGEKAVDEAWELGEELRRLHKALKEYKKGKRGNSFYGQRERRGAISGISQSHCPLSPLDVSDDGIEISERWSLLDNGSGRPQNPSPLGAGYQLASDRSSSIYEGKLRQSDRCETPLAECSHARFQELASSHPNYQPPYKVSIQSYHASVCNGADNWEWETPATSMQTFDTTPSEQTAHNYRDHLSLPPLQSPMSCKKDPIEISRPKHNSMYAGFGNQNRYYEDNVSSSHSPAIKHLGSVTSGYHVSSPRSPYENRSRTRQTEWGDLY